MKGEHDKALADFDEVIHIQPDFALAWYSRGNICNNKRNFDKAIESYNEATRLNININEAECSLGEAMHGRRRVNMTRQFPITTRRFAWIRTIKKPLIIARLYCLSNPHLHKMSAVDSMED